MYHAAFSSMMPSDPPRNMYRMGVRADTVSQTHAVSHGVQLQAITVVVYHSTAAVTALISVP